jgi:outer membrane protein assembly factor BamB
MFDSKTGNLKWFWADYMPNRKPSFSDKVKFAQNNKFLFTTWNDVYCLDALTGQSIWRSQLKSGSGSPRITCLNDYVYDAHEHKINGAIDNSHLVQASVNQGKWDTIFTQPLIDGFQPGIEPPTISWKNMKGEEIIFFQIRYWNFPASKGRIDWLAYNLVTKKEEYRFNNIDRGQLGNVLRAVELGEKVYFLCVNSLFCINKNDGNILWQKNFDSGEIFMQSNPFIAENILFIKPNVDALYAIDPSTGILLWADKNNGSGCKDMVYHDGLIYYSCSGDAKIYAMEAKTGKKIWAETSPNRFKNKLNGNRKFSTANIGSRGIAIDSTLGLNMA